MNQQSSSSAIISSTRSNKRSRGVDTERKDNGISQNPAPTTSTDENKCSSGSDNLLNSEATYQTNNTINYDVVDTANNRSNNNKRPRSRSGVSSHQTSTADTSTFTTDNGDSNCNNISDETVVNTTNVFPLNVKKESSQVPQMTEDYVELASHMMLHPLSQIRAANLIASGQSTTTTLMDRARGTNGSKTSGEDGYGAIAQTLTATPQSQYLVHMSALGYLKSPIRRPTVIEKWSPYEIAMFEASIAEHGKNFARIRNEIGMTKSVQDVIEFYYVWKKTSHYVQWKKEYIPEYLDVDVDE